MYIPRPAKLLFTVDDGWNRYLEKHGDSVSQMHWGGGTLTFLNKAQISRLMDCLRQHFTFNPQAEISMELDPREIELDMLDHLHVSEFNP